MADSDSGIQPQEKPKNGFAAGCYDWAEAFITALIGVMILLIFIFRLNIMVQGDSMLPNYVNGYRVFVSCADRNFQRGNVVVIDADGTKLKTRIIKRVIATEGQKVDINFAKGVVSVNGKELDESAYIQNGITKVQGSVAFPVTVPKGCVFVLGDNRPVSEDSRYTAVGMIDTRYIIGKASFIISPFHGFQSK